MGNFVVHRNKRYRATIQLGEREQFASNAVVADMFAAAGFTGIAVEGAGATRSAEATWPLEDATALLPSQIVSVSEIEEGA
jgi:hypothetical protein